MEPRNLEDTLVAFRSIQSQKIKEELEVWVRSSDSVNIFVTGKTGTGKSTLVNALIGQKMVAKEGEALDPMTFEVTCYEKNANGIRIRVWDSPGFQDGTGREAEYIKDMKAKCTNIDLCVFCINVSTARFTSDSKEVKALEKLTDAFGHSLWDHAVIALTFANELVMRNDDMRRAKRSKDMTKLSRLFKEKIDEWEKKVRATLTNVVKLNSHRVSGVTIIPTGFRRPSSLPDRIHWLSSFWFGALRSMHKKAQPAMVMLNNNRLVESPECIKEEEGERSLEEQSLIFSERGFEVGCRLGSPELGLKLGKEKGAMYCREVQAQVLLEQYVIEQSIQEWQKQQKSQQSVASGLEPASNMCSGSDTKGY